MLNIPNEYRTESPNPNLLQVNSPDIVKNQLVNENVILAAARAHRNQVSIDNHIH